VVSKGNMTVHDTVKVAGVTEACRYNDHTMCNNPSCGCDCHIKAAARQVMEQSTPAQVGPEKACPKCGAKRPWHEVYCRIDGERLSSLLCPICGAGKEPEDAFCWKCGSPKDAKPSEIIPEGERVINVPSIPSVESEQAEVDYGKQVLAKLQAEIGQTTEATNAGNGQVREVVEQVGGPQGTFKLVSSPNPNKVRAPQPSNAQPVKPKFRLPVKPSDG
jgi:ribosomal protein L40E